MASVLDTWRAGSAIEAMKISQEVTRAAQEKLAAQTAPPQTTAKK